MDHSGDKPSPLLLALACPVGLSAGLRAMDARIHTLFPRWIRQSIAGLTGLARGNSSSDHSSAILAMNLLPMM
jgi:hypothetical protein